MKRLMTQIRIDRRSILGGLVLLSLVLGSTGSLWACNIPVFRYALERWKPDACEVIVFHDAPFDETQVRLLKLLESKVAGPQATSLLQVQQVNVTTSKDSERLAIWKQLSGSGDLVLPCFVVRSQLARGQIVNGWHGPLDQKHVSALLDSPVRAELRKRLLKGDSVVWLMLNSRDSDRSQAVRKSLEKQFEQLQSKVQLPDGVGLPGSELFSDVPLLLRFSVLEIAPDDPREQFLVSLFSGFQSEAFQAGEPLLVPVFGRGRALEVIPAEDLDAGLVEDLTVFLCGACSCQVKEQNPGFDLLLNADWDRALFGEDGLKPPETAPAGNQSGAPRLVPIPPGRSRPGRTR